MIGQPAIRFAVASDQPLISQFLDQHWRKDHIFATNPELMRWQHTSIDSSSDALNFVLAVRQTAGSNTEIIGILGFIPFRRFDEQLSEVDLALAIWKVRDDAGVSGLGLLLLKAITKKFQPRLICAVGISQMVKPIYKALKYQVAELSHAALFNKAYQHTSMLAVNVPDEAFSDWSHPKDVTLLAITDDQLPAGIDCSEIDQLCALRTPQKSWNYLRNRYLNHPWYSYQLKAVLHQGRLQGIFIWRMVSVESKNARILRIVDYIGHDSAIKLCSVLLHDELVKSDCQYIDTMHYGLERSMLIEAGFVSTSDFPDLILPNYFEPFEPKKVTVELSYLVNPKHVAHNVVLFRADSDQDRPNTIEALRGKR